MVHEQVCGELSAFTSRSYLHVMVLLCLYCCFCAIIYLNDFNDGLEISLCTFQHLDPPLETRHMHKSKHRRGGIEDESCTKIQPLKRKGIRMAVGC